MNFISKQIPAKIYAIIDIGSYKIRSAICKFQNGELELIWYGEKRQNSHDIHLDEIQNLKGLCESISHAIEKSLDDSKISQWKTIQVENVILNIPFEEIFFEKSQINHIRQNTLNPISRSELYEILKEIELKATKKQFEHIKHISGYEKEDVKLIISWVNQILADSQSCKKLIWSTARQINISLLNIFIPETKYETIQFISRAIDKNISKIIPSEFAISGLFSKNNDVVIIDIGSYNTSIIIKKNGEILWVRKISVGIDSLITQIKEKYSKTKMEIINTIDENIYLDEKQDFLDIFKQVLVISLQDILWDEICPQDFFMIGWGSNRFIKNYLQTINLQEEHLKIPGTVKYITPQIEYLDNIDSSRSNLNIFAMMNATLDFIKKENDSMENILKKIAEEI